MYINAVHVLVRWGSGRSQALFGAIDHHDMTMARMHCRRPDLARHVALATFAILRAVQCPVNESNVMAKNGDAQVCVSGVHAFNDCAASHNLFVLA
jgi:hypothetical protein